MISLTRFYILVLAALLLVLSACGGGSEGGIGGSGLSSGVMQDQTNTGSTKTATVNGVTFNTANTTYREEGSSTSAASIQTGMVVVVQGSIDPNGTTGVANSIAYADLLEGPITDIGASSITAMGQTILVDGNTQYSGGVTDLAGLFDGDVIEVSGFFTADNKIYATYIEKTVSSTHEIKGVITAITPMISFNIGNLLVNWTNTAGLSLGDFVKAEGMMNGDTVLNATSVSTLTRNLEISDADDAEVEGLATTACTPATPPCTFMLGFITVQVNSSTEFEGGLLADIQPGTRLEVEGSLSNNVVIAEEIEFKDSVELISDVTSLDSLSQTFVLDYGATDVTVTYDPLITELDSIANFDAILAAGHVKVRARVAGNSVIATRVENSQGNTDLVLQGPVDAASNPNITILGVTINTNINGLKFIDQTENEILQTEFFNQVNQNTVVKAKGSIISSVITWTEIEIE